MAARSATQDSPDTGSYRAVTRCGMAQATGGRDIENRKITRVTPRRIYVRRGAESETFYCIQTGRTRYEYSDGVLDVPQTLAAYAAYKDKEALNGNTIKACYDELGEPSAK